MLGPVEHELAAFRTGSTTFEEPGRHEFFEAVGSHRPRDQRSTTFTVEEGAHDFPPHASWDVGHRRVEGGAFTNGAAKIVARRILVPSCVQTQQVARAERGESFGVVSVDQDLVADGPIPSAARTVLRYNVASHDLGWCPPFAAEWAAGRHVDAPRHRDRDQTRSD